MTTVSELPLPGVQSAEDRRRISRQLIIHAREELALGSRLQAGEKAWGAVVQPLKAVAEQRGWPHHSNQDVREVARQLVMEYDFDHDRSEALTDAYRVGHENFYENHRSVAELTAMIEKVEEVVPFLNRLTTTAPRPFTIASNTQLRRLRRLTNNGGLQIGDSSPVGFSLKHSPPPASQS